MTANGATLSILFGQGNGFFGPETRLANAGDIIRCLDTNSDDHDDLIYGRLGGSIAVRLGNGDGTFQVEQVSATVDPTMGFAIAEVNGDDIPDAIVVSNSKRGWRLYPGVGNGNFGAGSIARVAGADPQAVLVYDVDNDGSRDVIITNRSSDNVSVFLGDGFGNFEDQRIFGVGEEPLMSIASDVDNDGDDDLIVANSVSNSLSVLFNTAIELPIDPNDVDGDGVLNEVDNCPEMRNIAQANFDNDELGDSCDPDIDNDGVHNGPDVCDFTPLGASVQPDGTLVADADKDCDVDLRDYAILQNELTGAGQ